MMASAIRVVDFLQSPDLGGLGHHAGLELGGVCFNLRQVNVGDVGAGFRAGQLLVHDFLPDSDDYLLPLKLLDKGLCKFCPAPASQVLRICRCMAVGLVPFAFRVWQTEPG